MDPEMQRMLQQMSMGGGGMGGMGQEVAIADTAETVHISSLALLKMLKHGGCHVCSRQLLLCEQWVGWGCGEEEKNSHFFGV